MKFSRRAYPILELVEKNEFDKLEIYSTFTDEIQRCLTSISSREKWIENVKSFFSDFDFNNIHICFFAKSIKDRANLIKDKLITIYPEIPDSQGLYLLPDKTSILYKWSKCRMETIHFAEHNIVEVSIFEFEQGKIALNRIPEPGRADGKLLNNEHHTPGTIIPWIALIYLAFYHFAEIETKIISSATELKKTILNQEKYITDVKPKIEIIDSNWFTKIIRTTGFSVSGHFRLQPHGEHLSKRKLIWIDQFEKEGYKRNAQIEIK